MDAEKILEDLGYEDVMIFKNPSYDDALMGVDAGNRAVYDFEKMVRWLVEKDGIDEEDAIEFIEYNTIRALPYYGEKAPIVVNRINLEDFADEGDRQAE